MTSCGPLDSAVVWVCACGCFVCLCGCCSFAVLMYVIGAHHVFCCVNFLGSKEKWKRVCYRFLFVAWCDFTRAAPHRSGSL